MRKWRMASTAGKLLACALSASLLLCACGTQDGSKPEETPAAEDAQQNNPSAENENVIGSASDSMVLHNYGDEYILVLQDGAVRTLQLPAGDGTADSFRVDGNQVYYVISRVTNGDGCYQNVLCRLLSDGACEEILDISALAPEGQEEPRLTDVSDGKAFLLQVTYDADYIQETYNQTVYDITGDKPTEVSGDASLDAQQKLYEIASQNHYQILFASRGNEGVGNYSVEYMLKTFGMAVFKDNAKSRLVWFDADGNEKQETPWAENDFLVGITEKGMIYAEYVSTDGIPESGNGYYIYKSTNLQGENENMFFQEADGVNYYGGSFRGDEFYYHSSSNKEGVLSGRIEKYDLETKECKVLYEGTPLPGMTDAGNGGFDFVSSDGKNCYALAVVDCQQRWCRLDEEKGAFVPLDTDMVSRSYTFAEFGTVEELHSYLTCPECGRWPYRTSIEYFQVNDSYKGAELINRALKEQAEQALSDAEPSEETMRQDHEATHTGDTSYMEESSTENRLQQVDLFDDHLLQISYSGYSYWAGAAHGMPYNTYLLFDLNTGSQVDFADLYKGTPEQWKELVAKHTVEDAQGIHKDWYFETDMDALYKDAYDNAEIGKEVHLGPDGLVVEYAPYEYGSYASGFITVVIPYEELGMNMSVG